MNACSTTLDPPACRALALLLFVQQVVTFDIRCVTASSRVHASHVHSHTHSLTDVELPACSHDQCATRTPRAHHAVRTCIWTCWPSSDSGGSCGVHVLRRRAPPPPPPPPPPLTHAASGKPSSRELYGRVPSQRCIAPRVKQNRAHTVTRALPSVRGIRVPVGYRSPGDAVSVPGW